MVLLASGTSGLWYVRPLASPRKISPLFVKALGICTISSPCMIPLKSVCGRAVQGAVFRSQYRNVRSFEYCQTQVYLLLHPHGRGTDGPSPAASLPIHAPFPPRGSPTRRVLVLATACNGCLLLLCGSAEKSSAHAPWRPGRRDLPVAFPHYASHRPSPPALRPPRPPAHPPHCKLSPPCVTAGPTI